MNTDRNLLFGALAFQNEYIDLAQFAAVCRAWAADKSRPMADLLVERGWITGPVRAVLEDVVARKLARYGGDVHATLGAVAGADLRDCIRDVEDSDLRRSVSSLPPAAGHVLLQVAPGPAETLVKPAEARGRYTLTRLHGQGGLGRVWFAHDEALGRSVAIKELQPAQAQHPEAWRRFLKEAQVTGQLEHPNIVPVYDLDRRPHDNHPFYTMRFVKGQTLRDAIREFHGRSDGRSDECQVTSDEQNRNSGSSLVTRHSSLELEFRRLLGAFVAVCNAIAYAHSRGVIHRDLKPDNVVLGGFGEVKRPSGRDGCSTSRT